MTGVRLFNNNLMNVTEPDNNESNESWEEAATTAGSV